jgi:zinc finger SWIM domain-containing protein 3
MVKLVILLSNQYFKKNGKLKVTVWNKYHHVVNVKLLPEHYNLKRWSREARARSVHDNNGRILVADPKVDAINRTSFLSHKFYNLVTEESNSEECSVLIENSPDNLTNDVKERLLNAQATPTTSSVLLNAQVTTPSSNDSLAAARLKKTEVNEEDKSSKRRKSWTERQFRRKKDRNSYNHCTII